VKKGGRKMLIIIITVISVVLIPFVGAAIYAYYELEHGNFHQITNGEAYRSAQMNGTALEHCIKNYQIKSVLNLRGKFPDEKWYSDEIRVSSECGVKHFDLFLSAYRVLTPEETQTLMGIFETAPRPILIHCRGGADRSGLVSAMWKVIVDKSSKLDASKQLSIFYGHISLGPPAAMDRFFENWSHA
jgi:undecaprenyl-diphosphatase